MAEQVLDLRGQKCPIPSLKMTGQLMKMKKGDILEVLGDCPTMEKDVREWCTRTKTILLWVKEAGNAKRFQIQV